MHRHQYKDTRISLFLRVHSLWCFIPPSDYPPFFIPSFPYRSSYFLCSIDERNHDSCLSLLDLFHLALSPPVSSMLQQMWEIVLFDGWVIFHCMYGPHLLNPVIFWRASRLLPQVSSCGQCCLSMNIGVHMAPLHYICIFGLNPQ